MKTIVFYGDSITDMNRDRDANANAAAKLGVGYPNYVAADLQYNHPNEYTVHNMGISGNRTVDLYARLKSDVWNLNPDVWSILIGVNDVWHEIDLQNGVDIERFEKVYRAMIEETKARFPQIKILLCEPFVLEGLATGGEGRYERFLAVKEYAKVVKKLSQEYGTYFVPLQEKFDEVAAKYGVENYLFDGVHPGPAGAKLIATEWMKVFEKAMAD